ncbi:MAG TPA: DUF748 domain-containing protein [Candidatus Aquabacterium excrementipullorum]|nr:DUF748 domain-containing protein [Candidatus Aquabacterium excrementipullorum]
MTGRRRWLWWAAGLPVVLALAALLAYQIAVHRLQAGILQALGPHASVGAMDLGWRAVELRDLRLRASSPDWPHDDELRAARIRIVPDLRSVLRGDWRIQQLSIDGAYISVLRTRQGQLRVLPAWLEQRNSPAGTAQAPAPKARGFWASAVAAPASTASSAVPALTPVSSSMPDIHIQAVRLEGVQVGFFDASIRRPPHLLLLDQVQADIGPLALPALMQPAHIDLRALLMGPRRNGTITVQGDVTPATRDAKVSTELKDVDLIALQPYLLKLNDGGVKHGTLDMRIDATVQANRLHAPGRMTLTDLELGNGRGVLATVAGVPRKAVLAAMSKDGRIDLKFTLDGRLDDPAFSLNEQLALRTAAGLADALGVSLSGIAEGVGSVIKGLFGR